MSDQPIKTDELLLRLGDVVVLWAHLENWLGELLSFLLEANPTLMRVVTENVSSSTVVDWIRTLLQVPNVGIAPSPEIFELLKDIDQLRSERNVLVHGTWSFEEPETALVQTIRWGRAEVINRMVVTKGDLEQLTASITDALDELRKLGRVYGFPKMPDSKS